MPTSFILATRVSTREAQEPYKQPQLKSIGLVRSNYTCFGIYRTNCHNRKTGWILSTAWELYIFQTCFNELPESVGCDKVVLQKWHLLKARQKNAQVLEEGATAFDSGFLKYLMGFSSLKFNHSLKQYLWTFLQTKHYSIKITLIRRKKKQSM